MSLYASDLVLDQRSHRVGELVKRADAGKIAAIDRVRRGQTVSSPVNTQMTETPRPVRPRTSMAVFWTALPSV